MYWAYSIKTGDFTVQCSHCRQRAQKLRPFEYKEIFKSQGKNLKSNKDTVRLKLKLQYFGHLMWKPTHLEKTLTLTKTGGKRRSGVAHGGDIDFCSGLRGGGGLVAKSCPTLATPWTLARQAFLSMGFSRQEDWSALPFPSPGDLPDSGIQGLLPGRQILYRLSYEGSPFKSTYFLLNTVTFVGVVVFFSFISNNHFILICSRTYVY